LLRFGWDYEKLESDSLWTDGFSPFYADWKIVGKMSFPIKFKITSYEMIRKFLLMKNRGEKQVIDIDEAIEKRGEKEKEKGKRDEEEERLNEIEKRKEKMMKEDLLE